MIVLEFFGALIVMFCLWCYDERKTATTRYQSGMSAFPTGYAIEYKTTVSVYNTLHQEYRGLIRTLGRDAATQDIKNRFGSYRLGNEDNLILCYAIIRGRQEAIKNNRMPRCYNQGMFDGTIDEYSVKFGYRKMRADMSPFYYNTLENMDGSLTFNHGTYRNLLDIDKKTYARAVEVRKMAGCWTGEFERRFSL